LLKADRQIRRVLLDLAIQHEQISNYRDSVRQEGLCA
jgi:hypothetical protein